MSSSSSSDDGGGSGGSSSSSSSSLLVLEQIVLERAETIRYQQETTSLTSSSREEQQHDTTNTTKQQETTASSSRDDKHQDAVATKRDPSSPRGNPESLSFFARRRRRAHEPRQKEKTNVTNPCFTQDPEEEEDEDEQQQEEPGRPPPTQTLPGAVRVYGINYDGNNDDDSSGNNNRNTTLSITTPVERDSMIVEAACVVNDYGYNNTHNTTSINDDNNNEAAVQESDILNASVRPEIIPQAPQVEYIADEEHQDVLHRENSNNGEAVAVWVKAIVVGLVLLTAGVITFIATVLIDGGTNKKIGNSQLQPTPPPVATILDNTQNNRLEPLPDSDFGVTSLNCPCRVQNHNNITICNANITNLLLNKNLLPGEMAAGICTGLDCQMVFPNNNNVDNFVRACYLALGIANNNSNMSISFLRAEIIQHGGVDRSCDEWLRDVCREAETPVGGQTP